MDLSCRQVIFQDNPIAFTKSEYSICAALMENVGQVFSKSQIYEIAFGFEGESDESVIVEHIKNIRGKLKVFGVEPIETVWEIGYRWKREKLSA